MRPDPSTDEGCFTPSTYIPVPEFFTGKSVLITGSTGFLGKVLVEKLLRSCPGVKVIYLLIRPKRGVDQAARVQDIISSPLFDVLRKENASQLDKLVPVRGDISEPELGLNPLDQQMLCEAVSVVFHSAASVKFIEPFKVAVRTNLLSVQSLLNLCRRMKTLEALVVLSTVFCNIDKKEVEEVIYPSPFDPEKVIQLTQCLDDNLLDAITSILLNKKENTYVATKFYAEGLISQQSGDMPIAIVRPSGVFSIWREPRRGWLEGVHGGAGIFSAYYLGLLRSLYWKNEDVAECIPVDMVANLIICTAWRMATSKCKELQVYNCSTGMRNPLTYGVMSNVMKSTVREYPSLKALWYPAESISHRYTSVYRFNKWALHYLQAYLADMVMLLAGKEPRWVRTGKQLHSHVDMLVSFMGRSFVFHDTNTRGLWESLSLADQQVFYFDVTAIDWPSYLRDHFLGIREFVIKDPPQTLPLARSRNNRLRWLHYLLLSSPLLITVYQRSSL